MKKLSWYCEWEWRRGREEGGGRCLRPTQSPGGSADRVQTETFGSFFFPFPSSFIQGVWLPKMDQIIRFLKAHKYEIKKYGKKVRRRGAAQRSRGGRAMEASGADRLHPP